MFGIKLERGAKANIRGTNKNIIIQGGDIENAGEINMKETKLQNNCSFINKPSGKAKIEDLETDSIILNEGLFVGKRIKIFLKKYSSKKIWLSFSMENPIISVIFTLITLFLAAKFFK